MINNSTRLLLRSSALVVAGAALVGLYGALSPINSASDEQQEGDGVALRGLQRKSRLPLVIMIDDWYTGGSRNDDWWGDDWYDDDDDDDYTFVYKPVDTEYIVPTNGGYGGRKGRALSEIRFNKCPPVVEGYETNAWRYAPSRDYVKGVHKSVFPLMPSDYPLSSEKATVLSRETMADSVVVAGDFQLDSSRGSVYWLNQAVISPAYPGDADGKFWDELRHVVEVQIARRNGVAPSTLNRWPNTWSEKSSLEDIAKAVQGEYPCYHQQTLIEALFKEGVEMYRDMGPFRSVVDFVGTETRIAAINTWSFEVVAPINFMLKWHVGMPRPEEVAWMIYKDSFTAANDGVPEDLIALVKSMDMEHATSFTAYEDGSPMHPSYPAMHSAGSTCSYWLPAICKVTPAQYCEALRVDYAVAYGRTIAGVHYQQDNIAGLNIGQSIIRERLPAMLEERYGYDSSMVASKLDALSFDWSTFDSAECTIGGLSAAEFLANARR